MRTIPFLLALLISAPALGGPDKPENYCHDREANQKWLEILGDNHDSDTMHRLYALRLGLCMQVEREALPVGRAAQIFEREREEVLEHIKEERGDGEFGA